MMGSRGCGGPIYGDVLAVRLPAGIRTRNGLASSIVPAGTSLHRLAGRAKRGLKEGEARTRYLTEDEERRLLDAATPAVRWVMTPAVAKVAHPAFQFYIESAEGPLACIIELVYTTRSQLFTVRLSSSKYHRRKARVRNHWIAANACRAALWIRRNPAVQRVTPNRVIPAHCFGAYLSGVAASPDRVARLPPLAVPTTTTGTPRLYSGASRT
jgi:hypothetical protein